MMKRTKLWTALICLFAAQATYAHPIETEDFTSKNYGPPDVPSAASSHQGPLEPGTLPANPSSSYETLIDGVRRESIREKKLRVVSVDLTAENDDIWQRIRNGFGMRDLATPLVVDQQSYYLARQEYLMRTLERARPYLHMIVEEIEKRGMPTELALLPVVESAFNPTALSHANASGLWQFIPATGTRYGLEQNWWVDKRRDIIASTQAALEYLKYTYDMHGDWHLALASYNWGEGAVGRAVNKNIARNLPTSYEHLTMPKETQHYVPKLQAIKNIIANPHLYGVRLPHIPNEPYLATVYKQQSIDVQLAADLAEMPLKEFVSLNPSFKRPIIPTHQGIARIVLPADKVSVFNHNLARHKAANLPLVSWSTHQVSQPQPITTLAQSLGVSVESLRSANGLTAKTRTVAPGMTLLVPSAKSPVRALASNASGNVSSTGATSTSFSSSTEIPSPIRVARIPADSIDTIEQIAAASPMTSAVVPVRRVAVNDTASRVAAPGPVSNVSSPRVMRASLDNATAPRIIRASTGVDEEPVGVISLSIPVRSVSPSNSVETQADIARQMTNPPIETHSSQKVTPPASRSVSSSKPTEYVVKKGDTLQNIAKNHNVSVSQLRAINKIEGDKLLVGQKIQLVEKPGQKKTTNSSPAKKTTVYQVQRGDTLIKIAAKHQMTVAELKALNKLKEDTVKSGQKLTVNDIKAAPKSAQASNKKTNGKKVAKK